MFQECVEGKPEGKGWNEEEREREGIIRLEVTFALSVRLLPSDDDAAHINLPAYTSTQVQAYQINLNM